MVRRTGKILVRTLRRTVRAWARAPGKAECRFRREEIGAIGLYDGAVADIVIYKAPPVALGGDSVEAWEELAAQLRDLDFDVRREDRYMEPGRVGVIFGEVVWIYLGMKAIDVVTDHALEAALERVLHKVKTWGRERFGKRAGVSRPRPMTIQIADEDGKLMRSWKIDQGDELESSSDVEGQTENRPAVDVHGAAPSLPKPGPNGDTPQILLLLRLTHESTHLRVDAFVDGEHRILADLTHLPGRVAVSPLRGRVVTFQIDEIETGFGFQAVAEGYRCEAAETEDGESIVIFCYPEP